ncbi:hypothetical protein OL229_18185 [Neisseriaceae bacterium JH1-16]|nr:hypothetical protein [Neisseriaceae bacterium JH1-16]
MKKKVLLAASLLAAMGVAQAADVSPFDDGYAVAGRLSLVQGGGLELHKTVIQDTLNARLGVFGASWSTDRSNSGVDYNAKLKLFNTALLADYYPLGGAFRLSGGLVYNGNKLDLDGKPSNGSFTLNGHSYNASDIGPVQGRVDFNKVSPYLGIGWGNPTASGKGLSFVADIGVLVNTSPKAHLSASCGSLSAGDCAQLQSDVAAQQQQLNDDVGKLKVWPAVSLGVAYRFR